MIYIVLRFLAVLLLKIFFQVKAKGRENIPRQGGFILASNHTSFLDPVVLGVLCPRKLNYMARHDLFNNPLFGWLLSSINVFAVKRDSADFSAIKEAMHRLKSGGGLVVFPEGSRSIKGIPEQAQSGVGFLAAKAGVRVVPAFIKGTLEAWPKNRKTIRFTKISVSFGQQITIENTMPYQDIARLVLERIRHLAF
jgi:1-acyl-sn-glycerol-3-phosphate acyltransferase